MVQCASLNSWQFLVWALRFSQDDYLLVELGRLISDNRQPRKWIPPFRSQSFSQLFLWILVLC